MATLADIALGSSGYIFDASCLACRAGYGMHHGLDYQLDICPLVHL